MERRSTPYIQHIDNVVKETEDQHPEGSQSKNEGQRPQTLIHRYPSSILREPAQSTGDQAQNDTPYSKPY